MSKHVVESWHPYARWACPPGQVVLETVEYGVCLADACSVCNTTDVDMINELWVAPFARLTVSIA